MPLETYAVLRPFAFAARNTSTAHSEVMSGSLYVETIVGAPLSRASPTSSAAETSRGDPTASGSRIDWDVNQF